MCSSCVPSFAYLFERYPSFVQTFCYREAEEMVRQGMEPWAASIRHPEDAGVLLDNPVFYLPEEKILRAGVDARRAARTVSLHARRAIPQHRKEPDSQRLFEAIWLEPELRRRGIRHVHAHFGGVAARTACWLGRLFGFTWSFTGHANDIFCDNGLPISNAALVREARLIVTETDFARRWLEEHHPSAIGRVHRVFNGVSVEGFHERTRPAAVPLILSVGRYVEKKGFGDLIAACSSLAAQGLEFRCEIIGGGPLECVLATQISEAGLAGSVHLIGSQSQAAVRARLAAADLFVLASVAEQGGGSDNLPTVIMEAMMSGVPVVSTTVAGIPEMIDDGRTGRLVAPSCPAALAAGIREILADPVKAREWGDNGQRFARDTFDIRRTTRALKHLLVREGGVVPPPEALRLDPGMPAARSSSLIRKLVQAIRSR